MSKQSYQDFVTKLRTDSGLRKELHARFGDLERGIPGQELATFAEGKGYKFGVEELQGELNDDQLGAVSGGLFDVFRKGDAFSKDCLEKIPRGNVFVKISMIFPKLI